MKIHHVGYLVKTLSKASEAFEDLGFEAMDEVIFDEIRGVDILFMKKDGYVIELVSPKHEDAVVYNLMKKLGNTPYHFCYEVDDIVKTSKDLSEKGYVIIDKPTCAVAIEGRNVIFLMHPFMGMIELLEK
ncbi:MAG: VOC family protein [Lachnospiraceae bacterium]|nr:VOC family protein [Lachnospiraceae bacterium]